jgi:hypothetical protein
MKSLIVRVRQLIRAIYLLADWQSFLWMVVAD